MLKHKSKKLSGNEAFKYWERGHVETVRPMSGNETLKRLERNR